MLFAHEFDKNIEVLDLSRYDIKKDNDWANKIKDFANLKEVKLGNNVIPIATKSGNKFIKSNIIKYC